MSVSIMMFSRVFGVRDSVTFFSVFVFVFGHKSFFAHKQSWRAPRTQNNRFNLIFNISLTDVFVSAHKVDVVVFDIIKNL